MNRGMCFSRDGTGLVAKCLGRYKSVIEAKHLTRTAEGFWQEPKTSVCTLPGSSSSVFRGANRARKFSSRTHARCTRPPALLPLSLISNTESCVPWWCYIVAQISWTIRLWMRRWSISLTHPFCDKVWNIFIHIRKISQCIPRYNNAVFLKIWRK
jgi:hypothetical protein